MKDADILLMVRGEMSHLPRAEAVAKVAELYGLSVSGVSGRLSRAEQDPDAMLALTDLMTKQAHPSKAERDALSLVSMGQEELSHKPEGDYSAVYISDIHFPQHNIEALDLLLKVLRDIPDVRYVSALNDALDFARLSLWPERRRIRAQQLDDDFSYSLDIYGQWLKTLRLVVPKAQHVAIVGNHDARAARFGLQEGAAEVSQSYAMARLNEMGVLFTNLLFEENVWSPAPNTIWAHGYKAGERLPTVAQQAYDHFKWVTGATQDTTVITGHVHRCGDFVLRGGGRSIISGCFHTRHPYYMKTPPMWDYAFVLTQVREGNVFHDLVRFDQDARGMFCRFGGKLLRP